MFIVRIKNGLKAKGNRRGTRKNILCEDQEIPLKEFWYTLKKGVCYSYIFKVIEEAFLKQREPRVKFCVHAED